MSKRCNAIYRTNSIIFVGDTMQDTTALTHAQVAVLEAIFYAEKAQLAAFDRDRKNAPVDEWKFEGVRASKDTSSLALDGTEYPHCFRVQRVCANKLEALGLVVSSLDNVHTDHYETRFRLTKAGRDLVTALGSIARRAGKRYICLNALGGTS